MPSFWEIKAVRFRFEGLNFLTITNNMSNLIKIFNELKEKHPNKLILLGCKNCYKSFNQDAETIGQALGLEVYNYEEGDYFAAVEFGAERLYNWGYFQKLVATGAGIAVLDCLEEYNQRFKKIN